MFAAANVSLTPPHPSLPLGSAGNSVWDHVAELFGSQLPFGGSREAMKTPSPCVRVRTSTHCPAVMGYPTPIPAFAAVDPSPPVPESYQKPSSGVALFPLPS